MNTHSQSWIEGPAMKLTPLKEREMYVLLASVRTWMFSAQGHTYIETMEE